MIHNSKQLLKSLKFLKKEFNVVGIKSSFEDEGVIFNELIKLKELCVLSNLELNIKIGGCEAISDIKNCLLLNVNNIIAPMIESPFAQYTIMFLHQLKNQWGFLLILKVKQHIQILIIY